MNKHRLAYFLTVIAIFLNIALYWFGIYDLLEQNLYDYRFKLRGPLSGDYIYEQSNILKSRYNLINNKAIKLNHSRDNDVVINLDSFEYITEQEKIIVNISIEYQEPIHSMQFRLMHLPYLYQYEVLDENKISIHQIDGNEIAEDISVYSIEESINSFIDSEYNLAINYSNSVGFKLVFEGLTDFLDDNPEIYLDSLNTKVFLYPDTLNTKYIRNGDYLGLALQDSINEYPEYYEKGILLEELSIVELKVAHMLKDYINGESESSGKIDIFANDWYNGFSNIVFHGYNTEDELLKPRLEIYYSK